ncbi:MAG TPA: hypothetical protein VFJ49_09165 [Methyloceanibacter sp.]|nr:hypothetical protein [Methyloceanibacter sp.]
MMKRAAYLIAVTAFGIGAFAQTASAQQPVTQVIGGTTITLGGGAQLLSPPDLDFTFKVNEEGAAVHKQTNSDLDDYGGAFVGSVETPFGHWGGRHPVTGVVSGFFANVQNTDRRKCVSTESLGCEAEDIVDNPDRLDSFGFDQFKTNTKRDVDYRGVGGEAPSLRTTG